MAAPFRWLLPLLVLVSSLKLLSLYCPSWLAPTLRQYAQEPAPGAQTDSPAVYFFNEVTGQSQWVDPGDTPYVDESGQRYWLDESGQRMANSPSNVQYTWLEMWSEDLQKPYFYNQETKESVWERPADLAWRRIKIKS